MFDTIEKRKGLSKWIIGTFTCCILIYLGIRHVKNLAVSVAWLISLFSPLIIGVMLALILNVPMQLFEDLLSKTKLQGLLGRYSNVKKFLRLP